jgi:serine/threonine protein kinase
LAKVNSLRNLKHPNLINFVACSDDGVVKQIRGTVLRETKNVIYLVLELAIGGELFDYVSLAGKFPENIARYYFR